MRTIYNFLNKISSVPLLIIFLFFFIICIGYVLPKQKAGSEVYTRGAGSIGLSFFPMPDKVYKIAEAYGDYGRKDYIKVLLTYDLLWPFVYSGLFSIFINLSLGYMHGEKGSQLCAVALLPLLLDYMENIFAIFLLVKYPIRLDWLAWIMAVTTCLKWLTMGVAMCLVVYGIAALSVRFVYEKIKR